jgi:hypothetical protein
MPSMHKVLGKGKKTGGKKERIGRSDRMEKKNNETKKEEYMKAFLRVSSISYSFSLFSVTVSKHI